jgi:hypothetical protein
VFLKECIYNLYNICIVTYKIKSNTIHLLDKEYESFPENLLLMTCARCVICIKKQLGYCTTFLGGEKNCFILKQLYFNFLTAWQFFWMPRSSCPLKKDVTFIRNLYYIIKGISSKSFRFNKFTKRVTVLQISVGSNSKCSNCTNFNKYGYAFCQILMWVTGNHTK